LLSKIPYKTSDTDRIDVKLPNYSSSLFFVDPSYSGEKSMNTYFEGDGKLEEKAKYKSGVLVETNIKKKAIYLDYSLKTETSLKLIETRIR